MKGAKEGDRVYLENEVEVRWFLEHLPEAVRDSLKKLNVTLNYSGRITVRYKMGCPFGVPCLDRELVKAVGDPPLFSDLVDKGPVTDR